MSHALIFSNFRLREIMASCCSSYTPVAVIWAILSVLAAVICPFGLYFSNWIEYVSPDGSSVTSTSSFRICSNDSRITVSCDEYLNFNEIYSPAWQAVTLLFGLGSCLLILVALTALFGFCIKHLFNVCVVVITVISQSLGGNYISIITCKHIINFSSILFTLFTLPKYPIFLLN